MIAGKMRHRLELQRPLKAADAFGDLMAGAGSFEPTTTVWAERVTLRGSQRKEASERYSDYTAEFRIRDAHSVDNGWRVRQLGGYLYSVDNVIPNEERRYLTLQCSRINE